MSRAVKAGVLGLVIVATVWTFTLWRWHRMPQAVSGQDIALERLLQLVLLPLALTAVALVAWMGVRRLRTWVRTPLPTTVPLSGSLQATASAAPPAADASPVVLPLASVLAEALTLSAGDDAAVAWQALKDARVRPGLDPELQDLDGLPVFSARVPDLDVREWLLSHAELSLSGPAALPEDVLRTLALLEGPLQALVDAVAELQMARDAAQGVDAAHGVRAVQDLDRPDTGLPVDAPLHLAGVGRPDSQAWRQAQSERAPRLQVRLCLPARWSDEARGVAVDWVRRQCGSLLDWAERQGAPAPVWHTEPLPTGAEPEALWTELSASLPTWSASSRPQLMLLLVADTALDTDCILQWQARGDLFTSHHQRGRVPGEAAAGLLLANAAWCAGADISGPQLWPAQARQRERSADGVGRVGCEVTEALVRGVAERHAARGQADWFVVSDGDHRSSRTAEVFEALQAVCPQLDPMVSVVRAGEACGDMGLARALVPVALASAALRHKETGLASGLAVALLVQDSLARVAVPLTSSHPLSPST